MNPFVSSLSTESEITIARERLHPGIFILPVILVFVVVLPEILLIGMFEKMFNLVGQIGGPTQPQRSLSSFYALLILVGMIPGLAALLAAWFSYLKSEITLTNKRLLFRTGFISRIAGELPLENIESIYIVEPMVGRIFNYGTVAVTSVGGANFPLSFIGSPQQFHSKIQQAVTAAKGSPKAVFAKTPEVTVSPAIPTNDDSRYMPKR